MLKNISSPEALKKLGVEDLRRLAAEIRERIIDVVSRQGGHLSASLGAVELCIALHVVFDAPDDAIVFDVGHQAYAHKLLTGRGELFDTLRQLNGCAGFPSPLESKYDPNFAGHAGSALSTALGMAAAMKQLGKSGRAVAVVGDGALNCGITLEALNNARASGENLIIILNDNKMSISRNVGAIAASLSRMLSGNWYNRTKSGAKRILFKLPRHQRIHKFIQRTEEVLKSLLVPGGVFEDLGIRYIGPVDGHDFNVLLRQLRYIKEQPGPILLHVRTEKGRGYEFARFDPARYHGVSGFDRDSGEIKKSGGTSFSRAFGDEMLRMGAEHPELVAVTAAMTGGTGLEDFKTAFPGRFYDVGITEEHAVIFCAGMAAAGQRPVCAIYSTFIQRALDCIYCDVALNSLPVIFALDRSGVVDDGPTHHGIYDLGFLRAVPNLVIMTPRNEPELQAMMRFAYELKCPVAVRYPRGGSGGDFCGVSVPLELGRAAVIRHGSGPVIWAAGAECATALRVADLLAELDCAVVNTRFIAPFDGALARELAASGRAVISIENHSVAGGLADALAAELREVPHGRMFAFGWPREPIPHGRVAELREAYGLTAEAIAAKIRSALS